MQLTFRTYSFALFVIMAALLWLPATGLTDPVSDALQKAQESANQIMNKDQDKQIANSVEVPAADADQPDSESDASAPLQARYPGIENLVFKAGGNGDPASSIWYPGTGNDKVDAQLKEFVESQSKIYMDEVRDSLGEDGEKPESWSTWEQTGFFTLDRPNPDIMSFTFNIYSYVGGAHGQLLIKVMNFDMKTGKELGLADLFGDPQKAIALMSQLTAEKLIKSLGEDADEEMIQDGTEPEESNFSNLSLLADGLAVEFQPYQVGPWSIGQQQVRLTLQELAPAAPSKTVWPALNAAPKAAKP